MSIKDKTSLKTDNDKLYDDAIALTQEVTATLQKSVTNDQIDSQVVLKDRIVSVDVSVAPTAIILDFSNTEQFILDLTAEPATKIFIVTSILGIVSGQINRIEVTKNSDQSITLPTASGPVINKAVNPLQITGIGSPVSFVYGYLDDSNVTSNSLIFLEVFVDSIGGDDNNNGLTQANAVKTDDRAYTIIENSSIYNTFITRKRGGTYTISNDHFIGERFLTFLAFGTGAAPIVSSSGGELTISGLFAMFEETLSSAASSSYFFVINSLKVNLFGGELVADQSVIFRGGDGKILSFFINSTLDISGVTVATITDMPVRAVDIVGSTSIISGFADNTLSTILNVKDGLSPIIDITTQGEIVPFTTASVVTLTEKGLDKNTWELEHKNFSVGGIESINFLNETSIGSSVADIWIDTPEAQMFVLGFGGIGIVQRFTITNGDVSTLSEDIGNFIDLTSFGITVASSLHLSQAIDKLVVADTGTDKVYSLNIVTPGDLTSIVAITTTFDPGVDAGAQDALPLGIWLSNDGLNLIMTGNTNKSVYQFTLGSAFNVAGAGVSFITKFTLGGIPTGVHLSFDGLTMYIWDYSLGRLRELNLGNQYVVSGAIDTELVVITSGGTANENAGVHLNDVQNKMYLITKATNVIQQYNFNGKHFY